MTSLSTLLTQRLSQRKSLTTFRTLSSVPNDFVDFVTNDYLGLGRRHRNEHKSNQEHSFSPCASRLLGGNEPFVEEVEQRLAEYYGYDEALLFPSGYAANVGLLSALPTRHDTVFYDELIHASVRDGIRVGHATSYSFRHNTLEDLEKKLRFAKGTPFICVESLYSMDGDWAPLEELTFLAQQYEAVLIVDEAHSTGICGTDGSGRVKELSLTQKIPIVVHTFGKAFGAHGAVIVGNAPLRDYLINFARSFIYSTAPSLQFSYAISEALHTVHSAFSERQKLWENIAYVKTLGEDNELPFMHCSSPIVPFFVGSVEGARSYAARALRKKLVVRPILSPTVPQHKERIRLSIHANHSKEELATLVTILSEGK